MNDKLLDNIEALQKQDRHDLTNLQTSVQEMELNQESKSEIQREKRWIDNKLQSKCFDCKRKFTFFTHKYHCHACGVIICKKCSYQGKGDPKLLGMPSKFVRKIDYKTDRICQLCHNDQTKLLN